MLGRRARWSVGIAAVALFAALEWPAGAATPPVGPPVVPPSATAPQQIGTLSDTTPLLSFSGSVGNPTPLPLVNSPVPAVCASPCKEFTFAAQTGQPFLVSIKNTVAPGGTFNANDGFDLYLYGPSGTLIDSGNGIGSNGQSLMESAPARGAYTIVVTFTYAEDPDAAYAGEVRMITSSTWAPPPPTCGITVGTTSGCFELPALKAVPAYDLAVTGLPPVASTPLGFPFPVSAPTSNSCYADESLGLGNPSPSSIENPATRCLRFTSDVQDVGAGALEVQIPWVASGSGAPQSGFLPGGCQAQQVITSDTGATVTKPAGACEFHPEHGHFHYEDLVSFTLYTASNGAIGQQVGNGLKESFCLGDDDYFGYASTGPNGPREFVGQPGCNLPSQTGPSGAYVLEGISPGWGDVYTWDTPDQYINITGVAPGTYDLVEKTNPSGSLLVSGSQQTCALTQLQLDATSVKALSTQSGVACP